MAVSPELIEKLRCPVCRTKVNLTADGKGLKCSDCKRVYPIRRDIPVMIADEASFDREDEVQVS
jgi:uncharacterized protein